MPSENYIQAVILEKQSSGSEPGVTKTGLYKNHRNNSVSPSPKKGHGRFAEKGYFHHAATCQKSTFSARQQANGHLF